jgi:hypothetical protein
LPSDYPRLNPLSDNISRAMRSPSVLDWDRERRDNCALLRESSIKKYYFSTLTRMVVTMSPMGQKSVRAGISRAATKVFAHGDCGKHNHPGDYSCRKRVTTANVNLEGYAAETRGVIVD